MDPQGLIEENAFLKFIRKLAHGVEFCILGCCMGGLLYSINAVYQHYNLFMMLFVLLSTAVIDEYIQSFMGRTSSVKDILIDFGGAVVGVLLVVIIMTMHKKYRRR